MITLMNIHKSFEQKSVLNDISFDIPENSITTLVGPNGIGKTTLLNILCGFIYPDKGKIICDTSDFRKDIFTVSASLQLYAKNTVKENIIFLSILKGRSMPDIENNIKKYKSYFPIYDSIQSKLFEELSTGQKRLMIILAALVVDAKYLLLDEPTEGLDLKHKKQLTELLHSIKSFKTIIITSHDSEFIAALADKLIFLKDGKIVMDTSNITLDEFLEKYNLYYLNESDSE